MLVTFRTNVPSYFYSRTARSLASLILFRRGIDTKRFFALDDYYDSDRSGYYRALQSVRPDTLDLTEWLEYFTRSVMMQIEQVRQKILGLSLDVQKKKDFGQVALTKRQMRISVVISENTLSASKVIKNGVSVVCWQLKVQRQVNGMTEEIK